jgi:hypothetical protein
MSKAAPSQDDFEALLGICAEMAGLYPGLVYIGGIAVYFHAINTEAVAQYAETTHDGDFYIALADFADLRDIEELTPNRRLSKHQFLRDVWAFDVYLERQSGLIVPYDAVAAHAIQYAGVNVACIEHLVALKIEAYRDRKGTMKGGQDASDLLRLGCIAASGDFHGDLVSPYLTPEHCALLQDVHRSPEAVAMAEGNAQIAKQIRAAFQAMIDRIDGCQDRPQRPSAGPRY